MFRLPLILMLVSLQLLSGSSRAVYLCINANGDVCGLDGGPDNCSCFHRDERCEATDARCDHHAAERGSCPHADHECHATAPHSHPHPGLPPRPQQSSEDEASTVAFGPCDCTHELLSSGQAVATGRASASHDLLNALQSSDGLPALSAVVVHVCQPLATAWLTPPAGPNATLTVLSTVNIRC